jgi:UDP-glucose:(glucosyl)LPS alpha-1,2-glucosyltransferase
MTVLKVLESNAAAMKKDLPPTFQMGGDNYGAVTDNGIISGAKGGTEMMYEKLMERVNPNLTGAFNFICSRVRDLDPNRPNILWLHDTWDDPESQHLKDESSRQRFAKLVFVSNHQMNTYMLAHGLKPSECAVMLNAIDPIEPHQKDMSVIRCVYHTTPHRGLELLVPVFEWLLKQPNMPKLHLDVFSSFAIYNRKQSDQPYEQLFERIRNHPNMTYHGSQPNDVVREALKKAHIFAYPNIWPETGCIAAMEAMSAGCAVVTNNNAALYETLGGFGMSYQYDEDPNRHANTFAHVMQVVIQNLQTEMLQQKLQFQKIWADNMYSWDRRASEWEGLLEHLLNQKNQ